MNSINESTIKFGEFNSFGENLLTESLQKYIPTTNNFPELGHDTDNIHRVPHKGRAGCPVTFSFTDDPLSTTFHPHYELFLIFHPYDFLFDKINYDTDQLFQSAKTIRSYPRHIRNTLFVRSEKVKQIRKMDFSKIYDIAETLREKCEESYRDGNFYEALSGYNLIYSLFKWIEFKERKREKEVFSNLSEIAKHPIIDEDIREKKVKIKKKNIDQDLVHFNKTMLTLLKAMSYCYIHLRAYSEAVKCLNEAFEYDNEDLPDLYFRRGQARMYNKYSTINDLMLAKKDFNNARVRKPDEPTIEEQYKIFCEMVKKKENDQVEKISRMLLFNI